MLFFLVAALISLTTMTRMVEEQRTQIGTMKALGYGKGAIASKYIFYEIQTAPQKGQNLQKHALSGLRRSRTHKLGRNRIELAVWLCFWWALA